jgi:septal ring factor EnvC (AmiA/AmiB activator)
MCRDASVVSACLDRESDDSNPIYLSDDSTSTPLPPCYLSKRIRDELRSAKSEYQSMVQSLEEYAKQLCERMMEKLNTEWNRDTIMNTAETEERAQCTREVASVRSELSDIHAANIQLEKQLVEQDTSFDVISKDIQDMLERTDEMKQVEICKRNTDSISLTWIRKLNSILLSLMCLLSFIISQ